MKLLLVCIGLVLLLTGCPSLAPIPENVYYVDPPESIGEIGNFIGAWQGVWKYKVGHRLYVQEITGSNAKVIISTGETWMEGYYDIDAEYRETQGVFIGKDMVVRLDQAKMKMKITYSLNDDDTLSAYGEFHPRGASKPYKIKTILKRDQDGTE
jgi:hypothetical protein